MTYFFKQQTTYQRDLEITPDELQRLSCKILQDFCKERLSCKMQDPDVYLARCKIRTFILQESCKILQDLARKPSDFDWEAHNENMHVI